MTTQQTWLIRAAPDRQSVTPLPTSAPLAARVMHSAYWTFAPAVQAEVRRGHFGARVVTLAFEQLEAVSPAPVRLTRGERARAGQYLRALHERQGGVL